MSDTSFILQMTTKRLLLAGNYSPGPRSAPSGEARPNVRMKCRGRVKTDSEFVPQGSRSAMVVAVSDGDHLREGNQALRSHLNGDPKNKWLCGSWGLSVPSRRP